jgi:hypothetical protein
MTQEEINTFVESMKQKIDGIHTEIYEFKGATFEPDSYEYMCLTSALGHVSVAFNDIHSIKD